MAGRFNPNFRRNKLAEQVLCSLLMNPSHNQSNDWYVDTSLRLADLFIEKTTPDSLPDDDSVSSVEVDEFDDPLVIDSESV